MKRALLALLVACTPAGSAAPKSIVVASASSDAGAAAPSDPDRPPRYDPAPVELALSEVMACVRAKGRVHCTNDLHQGLPLTSEPPLPGIEDAISVSLGAHFGCVATRAGKVFCFGDNTFGQLGAGLRAERSDLPVEVAGLEHAARVFTGRGRACAILSTGGVACWGQNDKGQTGASTSYRPAARELVVAESVPSVAGALAVAIGNESTYVAAPGHGTWAFGLEIGSPRLVPRLDGFDEITSASSGGYCGIKAGEISCWGDLYALLPREENAGGFFSSTGVKGARRVQAGSVHACALLESGAVTCWGSAFGNVLGRKALPIDSTVHRPEIVAGLAPAVDIAVGGTTSCALASRSPTTAQCWGRFSHDPAPSGGSVAGQETSEPVTIRLTE